MLKQIDATFASAVCDEKTTYAALKAAKENRDRSKDVLRRNLAGLENLTGRLSGCCFVKNDEQYLNPSRVWDAFHGESYQDLFDDESTRTKPGQFLAAIVSCCKDLFTDTFEAADRDELRAIVAVLGRTDGFSLKSGQTLSKKISGDYAVKSALRARFVSR